MGKQLVSSSGMNSTFNIPNRRSKILSEPASSLGDTHDNSPLPHSRVCDLGVYLTPLSSPVIATIIESTVKEAMQYSHTSRCAHAEHDVTNGDPHKGL